MKNVRLIIVAVVMVLLVSSLAACSASVLEYGTEYNQVFYNQEEQKFMPSGNSIKIGDEVGENYKYQETYVIGNGKSETFGGTYVRDDSIDLMYMELNTSSFEKFKKNYKSSLSSQGFTRSEIDNIIMPNVKSSGEMFRYKGYMFKSSAIIAAKIESEGKRLNELDGLYGFTGLLKERDSVMKVERNSIYLRGISETGEPIYTKQIGVCELNGDIITIQPTVALEGGDPNEAMKYLVADIILPAKYAQNLTPEGKYNDNKVITYYEGVKVRVIVSNFYTLKETK